MLMLSKVCGWVRDLAHALAYSFTLAHAVGACLPLCLNYDGVITARPHEQVSGTLEDKLGAQDVGSWTQERVF